MIYKNILCLSLCVLLFSCTPSEEQIEIPTTSKVEDLIEHSKEFEKNILSQVEVSNVLMHSLLAITLAPTLVYGDLHCCFGSMQS